MPVEDSNPPEPPNAAAHFAGEPAPVPPRGDASETRYIPPLRDFPRLTESSSKLWTWLESRDASTTARRRGDPARPWYQVLWLTGMDYFSSLGYQPGIALLAAGVMSPVATCFLIVVTLFGALPIYAQVAARSYAGQGSVAMLERILPGWWSKIVVLTLLGFASTDFVITMTLSAADAAKHLVENPIVRPYLGYPMAHMVITLVLLALLAAVFLRGFSEAIRVAVFVGLPYIALNVVVVVRCLVEIFVYEPSRLADFRRMLFQAPHGDWGAVLFASALIFPKLALGLSGFETGVSVMPHVQGASTDRPGEPPHGRILATRKLLLVAALIMSLLLVGSSYVCTVLIPESAYQEGGDASGRALAYLAHQYMGPFWGTAYDLCTIAILWFAGASAMAGMLTLIPRYLPRFGMAPHWVELTRPLVLVLLAIDVLVTFVFRASVEAQGSAYATGVLVLMLSASIAVALSTWREARAAGRWPMLSLYFWGVAVIFGYTTITNVIERPDGVIISSIFICAIMLSSFISRWQRATELRVETIAFYDDSSARLWPSLSGKRVNLVPVGANTEANRQRKADFIRGHYKVYAPMVFLHVSLADDRSDFTHEMELRVERVGHDFVVTIDGAVAIANTVAYVSELIDPIGIYCFLTRESPLRQALSYLLWGEGEVGILVYQILLRYWKWTPGDDVRPLIYLMSD